MIAQQIYVPLRLVRFGLISFLARVKATAMFSLSLNKHFICLWKKCFQCWTYTKTNKKNHPTRFLKRFQQNAKVLPRIHVQGFGRSVSILDGWISIQHPYTKTQIGTRKFCFDQKTHPLTVNPTIFELVLSQALGGVDMFYSCTWSLISYDF